MLTHGSRQLGSWLIFNVRPLSIHIMHIPNLLTWWRRLPRKTRVRLIACVFLELAGTEVVFVAPHILELAAMIDVLGFTFVPGAMLTSIKMWWSQVEGVARSLVRLSLCGCDAVGAWFAIAQKAMIRPAFLFVKISRSLLYWSSVAACSIVCFRMVGAVARVILK